MVSVKTETKDPGKPVRKAPLRTRLLVSLAGLAVALLLMEVSLRGLGYRPYYLDGHAFVPSHNPEILYELRPGFRGLYAGVPISVNSLGFRGKDLPEPSDESAFRVAVLGDSIAFGQGVREGETLAEQLNVRLREKLRRPVQVVNAGTPMYDTCQEYWTLKQKVVSLKPHVLVLLYCDNDTEPASVKVEDDAVITPDVRTGSFGDLMATLRKQYLSYNLIWSHWQVMKRRGWRIGEYSALVNGKFTESNPGWRKSRTCMEDLISLARSQSMRVIIIPFPVLGGLSETPYPFAGYVNTVCDAAKASGAECLDIVPVLKQPGITLKVSNIETHPSAEVYARVAERLGQILP